MFGKKLFHGDENPIMYHEFYKSLTNEVTENYAYNEQLGRWIGNPSKAKIVTQYIHSLKKRKARAGVKPNSVRAITQEDLMSFYERYKKNKDAVNTRQFCIYIFSFISLLRSGEALKQTSSTAMIDTSL